MGVDALRRDLMLGHAGSSTSVSVVAGGCYAPAKGIYTIPFRTKEGEKVYQAPVRDNVFVAPCWSNGEKFASLLKGQAVSYLQAAIPMSSRSARQAVNRTATLVLLSEIENHLKEHPEGGYFVSSLFGGQYLTVLQKEEDKRDFDAEVDCI